MALATWELDGDDQWLARTVALMQSTPARPAPLNLLEQVEARRPAWYSRAACRGLGPSLFYDRDRVKEAAEICTRCPTAAECAEAGRREGFGVWAGEFHGSRAGRKAG